MNNNTICFENLQDGAYLLMSDGVGYYQENINFSLAEFNKLYVNKIRLPEGSNNIVYLLSDSFNNSIRMILNKHFVIPPSYKKFFYPMISMGKFMNKRYSFNVKTEVKNRNDEVKNRLKMRPYSLRTLPRGTENVLFCTSDLYNSIKPILEKSTIIKNYQSFFSDFFNILNSITPDPDPKFKDKPNSGKRVLIIDCESFSFNPKSSLKENKTNPLYLLYMAFLRTKDLSTINIDIDILICYRNMFYKFNPSKLTSLQQFSTFKRVLFKIININLDDYNSQLSEEDKKELNEIDNKTVDGIINKAIDPYVKNVSDNTKQTLQSSIKRTFQSKVAEISALDKTIKDVQKRVSDSLGVSEPNKPSDIFQRVMNDKNSLINTNPVRTPLSSEKEKLFNVIGSNYAPLTVNTDILVDEDEELDKEDERIGIINDIDDIPEEDEEAIENDVNEILSTSEEIAMEVLDEIQSNTVPLKDKRISPVISERDAKLREEQRKIVVKNKSIDEILSQDTANVPIEVSDKSAVMHTSNQNMHKIKFANFNKTYLEKVYDKQILACFDVLKDQEAPFYITKIEVKDTSDYLNLRETWSVHIIDENNKKSTIVVDIPKFINYKFLLYQGTKYIVLNQNMYNPLVKDTPDSVIVTTNYYKITVERNATKSISTIERIFSLAKKTGNTEMFIVGDSSKSNLNSNYISSLEYDELSRRLFKFSNNGCEIFFSRDYIKNNIEIPKGIKGDEFYIGKEGSVPIFINEDTGLDRSGRTIADIIEANLNEDDKNLFNSIKAPAQSMYVKCKLAGQYVPIIVVFLIWDGLRNTLNNLGINWKFTPGSSKLMNKSSMKQIRFANGILEYEPKIYAELVLNGLSKLHPSKLRFEDFESEICYDEFIYATWGTYNGILEVSTFKDFLIDPITKDACRAMSLPDDPSMLLIYAVKLLSDNKYVSKVSDKSYRTRTLDCIPGILYSCIAAQYKQYIKRGRRIPMTLKRSCVFDRLIAEKTVETYSTLNPAIEVAKSHTISPKGYRGSNSEYSYSDEKKRSYDPSSIGKIAITTSADGNVGINRSLTIDPTISNVMGYRDQVDDIEELKDVNVFAPIEMLTPGTIRYDDPIRSAIAAKQSQHVVPVVNASPSLISNGYDEAIQFELSDDFVINAEEDGKVIDINEELGFIVVEYKSGKKKAINVKPKMVYNSGSGFYMSNQLTAVYTKIGEKFKKDMPLAYHDKFFTLSKLNGLRYAFGPITKVAFMSTYNTYEDGGICTESLSERMASSIVYDEKAKFKRNNNILNMVKIGDHVNIGDSLIQFDVSSEDNEIAKYLTKLSDENAHILEEQTKNDFKCHHAGVVVGIEVDTLLDPSNLSPSLANIVQSYFDQGLNKKEYLNQFDNSDGIVKAGYVLTDSTEPVKNKYNAIKGFKGVDVLITIFIEHKDVMGVGDKVALHTANKQIISQKIPKGYEPYSEFRPDEEISVLTSPGTLERRMTKSVVPIAAGFKCLIELKRKIKQEIKYK